jgi:hypothetical protein
MEEHHVYAHRASGCILVTDTHSYYTEEVNEEKGTKFGDLIVHRNSAHIHYNCKQKTDALQVNYNLFGSFDWHSPSEHDWRGNTKYGYVEGQSFIFPDDIFMIGSVDVREGLRRHFTGLLANGTFSSPWPNVKRKICMGHVFLDRQVTQGIYDAHKYPISSGIFRELEADALTKAPQWFIDMVGGSFDSDQ